MTGVRAFEIDPADGRQGRGIHRTRSRGERDIASAARLLPDGSAVLFTVVRYTSITPDWKRAEVWVKSLATGERKRLLEDATDARYAGNGC